MNKKTLITLIMSLSLTSIPTAYASGLPTVDVAKWGALLEARLKQMQEFKDNMELKAKELGLDAEIVASKIDNFNNGASNYVIRKTQNMSDMFNIKELLSALPTELACEQMSAKANLDTLLCNSQKHLLSLNEEVKSIDDPLTAAERKESGEENVMANFYGYIDYDEDGDVDSLDVQRAIIKRDSENPQHMYESISSLVNFSDSHITLNPEQLQAAKDAISIIAPTFEEPERLYGDSPEGISARLRVEKEKAIQSSVFNTYHTLLSQKASSNPEEYGPSVLHSAKLQSEIFYSEDDIENTIAFKASTSQVSSPAQMYRYLATSYAMNNDQAYRKYVQSLRDESLQAQKLILLQERRP